MMKVEENDSSKEEQPQKMGQLMNRKGNEPEVLVKEREAGVTRAASH